MKKPIIIAAIFLLVVGVLSVTLATASGAEAEEEYATKTLTVKIASLPTFWTGTWEKAGDRMYAEYNLFDPEDEGIVGHYLFDAVKPTFGGWYASEHFGLDGLGAIETVGEGDLENWAGAIIGGTGFFAGASGEWHAESGICIFSFEKPVKLPYIE